MNNFVTFIDGLNPSQLFYSLLIIIFIILKIPGLKSFFRTLNTFLHENGHALMAILLQGEVLEIKLNSNTSGSAFTKTSSGIKAFLVSFAGYPLASLGALGLLALSNSRNFQIGFFILFSLSVINLVLFIRNAYGIFWLFAMNILMFLISWHLPATLAILFFMFISQVAFIEGVSSAVSIIIQAMKNHSKAGDLTNLEKLTKIPAFFWALLMAVIIGCITWFTVSHYFPPIVQLFNDLAV
ncbi:MAG: M50 family metallopeptidase [Lentimicrobium sp.]|nr:M50 family metallopeptidase [Lentimicrobium sp.]